MKGLATSGLSQSSALKGSCTSGHVMYIDSAGVFAREVFLKHYDKLSKLRLEILASNLITEEVITTDDDESIRAATSTSDKSAIILRAISSHLDVDYADSFFLLLDLMERLGDCVMQKVAGEINQQLNRPSRGK